MTARTVINHGDKPRFLPHVRFSYDKRRDRWVVLAPERMLLPDDISVEILRRCDGETDLTQIINDLSVEFDAPRDEIAEDVVAMVQDLTDKGILSP